MVAGQRALHQSLHPQAQPVQFVVDLQGGRAAGSVGFAARVVRPSCAAAAAPFVLGSLGAGVLAGVDGFEHAEVLLVAVEGQHEACVVNCGVPSLVFVVVAAAAVDLCGVRGEFQEAVHPLPVLVQVQEGEVQRQTPVRSRKGFLGSDCLRCKTGFVLFWFIFAFFFHRTFL